MKRDLTQALPDLSTQAFTVSRDNLDDLDWLYEGAGSGPEPVDLQALAIPTPWERKRTLWMVYADAHPDLVVQVLDKITDCSHAVLLDARAAGSYALDAAGKALLKRALEGGRFSLICGGSLEQRARAMAQMLDINKMDAWKVVIGQEPLKKRPEDVRTLFRLASAQINTRLMIKSTTINMSALFLRSTLINAPWSHRPAPLAPLENSTPQRPALIVSAGPSLNKQLPLLAQHQDLFTIIAVDTVWPILHRHGIVPDYLVAVDPLSPPSWPEAGLSPHTRFVVDICASPKVVWSHDRIEAMTSNPGPYSFMLDRLGGHASLLPVGGSVATMAFNLGVHLGANPLVFIGQDLALTGGKDHADGYLFTYDQDLLSSRSHQGYDVEGYYGGKVRTERQLLVYKTWFEDRIKTLPDRMVINATEGGARIAGTLQVPFALVCQEIASTSLRKTRHEEVPPSAFDAALMARLIAQVDKLCDGVKDYQALALKAESHTRGRSPEKKRLKEIDRVNRKIKAFDPAAKFLIEAFGSAKMESIRYQVSTDEEEASLGEAMRRYREVYQGIQDSADAALGLLTQVREFYEALTEAESLDPAILRKFFP